MTPFELIKECIDKIMVCMRDGSFTLKELEFLEEFYMEASETTTRIIKRIDNEG